MQNMVHERLTDTSEQEWHWSKFTWWKAMHYSHIGHPSHQATWGIYAGNDGFTGLGDAEISHFMQIPDTPNLSS